MRGHTAPEGFASCEEWKTGRESRRLRNCRADCGLGEFGRIRSFGAALHVRKLVAQRGDAALRKALRDGGHELMRHAGAGAVRQHIARMCVGRRLQQTGDAMDILNYDGDGLRDGGSHFRRLLAGGVPWLSLPEAKGMRDYLSSVDFDLRRSTIGEAKQASTRNQ